MELKRDHWTNAEVINFLEGMKYSHLPKYGDWNASLDMAITQFYDFKREPTEFAAMAYDVEKQEIVVVGPPLPR